MAEQNTQEQNFSGILETMDETASRFFEGVTEAFVGSPETLRDGTEFDPLELPRDLFAHQGAQTEWWYYTGHAKTDKGTQFGFELVFFKRRTDLDKFGPVPLRLLGNPIYFAHFAITDYEEKSFKYAHRKSANGWLDDPASASENHFHLRLGDWSIRESHGDHVVRATLGDGILFEASLRPGPKLILNGKNKDGVSYKDEGQASRYFSHTRMALEGDITINDETEHFTGSAWMDREFGTWTPTEKQKGWDWFSIQLDDDSELMVYQLRDSKNNVSEFSSGVVVESDGSFEPLSHDDFEVKPTGYWKSEKSGATYPSGWKIIVAGKGIELTVTPVILDQELDTRGTTMIVYWEGACEVLGTKNGEEITGKSYVELVGYDRSHEKPNLSYFLMANRFESA
jgi:predicted secreted hydrolase